MRFSQLSFHCGLFLLNIIFHDLLHDDLFLVEGVVAPDRSRLAFHFAAVHIKIIMQHKFVVPTLTFVLLELIGCTLPPEATVRLVRNYDSTSSRISQSVFSTKRVSCKPQILVCLEWIRFILRIGP